MRSARTWEEMARDFENKRRLKFITRPFFHNNKDCEEALFDQRICQLEENNKLDSASLSFFETAQFARPEEDERIVPIKPRVLFREHRFHE